MLSNRVLAAMVGAVAGGAFMWIVFLDFVYTNSFLFHNTVAGQIVLGAGVVI